MLEGKLKTSYPPADRVRHVERAVSDARSLLSDLDELYFGERKLFLLAVLKMEIKHLCGPEIIPGPNMRRPFVTTGASLVHIRVKRVESTHVSSHINLNSSLPPLL